MSMKKTIVSATIKTAEFTREPMFSAASGILPEVKLTDDVEVLLEDCKDASTPSSERYGIEKGSMLKVLSNELVIVLSIQLEN